MKKSKLLQQKLNTLAGSANLDMRTIQGASQQLAQRQNKKRASIGRYLKPAFAIASVLVIVIVAVVMYQSFIGRTTPNTSNPHSNSSTPNKPNTDSSKFPSAYTLSSLKAAAVSKDNIIQQAIPLTTLQNAELRQRTYSYNNDIAVVATSIVNVTTESRDELIILQDRGCGLKDYQSYKSYAQKDIDGIALRCKEEYKNGEYYSYCYYSTAEADYYIVIMSPNSNATNYYFQQPLN